MEHPYAVQEAYLHMPCSISLSITPAPGGRDGGGAANKTAGLASKKEIIFFIL